MAEQSIGGQAALDQRTADTSRHSSNGVLPESIPLGTQETPDQGELSTATSRFWETVKRLPAYVRLTTHLAKDAGVPKQAKAMLAAGGAYAVSPIDLVPGIIPVAGQLDDVYVLLTAIQQALKRTPDEVANRHLANAKISREDIDGDLQSVRDLVRVAVVKSIVIGGKTLGRVSRAAFGFANEQLNRRKSGRTKGPQ